MHNINLFVKCSRFRSFNYFRINNLEKKETLTYEISNTLLINITYIPIETQKNIKNKYNDKVFEFLKEKSYISNLMENISKIVLNKEQMEKQCLHNFQKNDICFKIKDSYSRKPFSLIILLNLIENTDGTEIKAFMKKRVFGKSSEIEKKVFAYIEKEILNQFD